MSDTFRLTTVERLRTGRLAQTAHALAQSRRGVDAAQLTVLEVTAELGACMPAAVAGAVDVRVAATRRDHLRERLILAEGELDASHQRLARALTAWTTARSDLRAVEALHDRHRAAVREEELRAEQRVIDDLAGSGPTSASPHSGGDAA